MMVAVQNHRFSGWIWLTLIIFALVLPIGLPAAGATRLPERRLRSRRLQEPLYLPASTRLFTSPCLSANVVTKLSNEVKCLVLRRWLSASGCEWLHVRISVNPFSDLRGWIQHNQIHQV